MVDNQVQGVDYAYTLQGWLKGTNSSSLTADRDMGGDSQSGGVNQYFAKDVASFSLHYFDGDYHKVENTDSPTFLGTSSDGYLLTMRQDLWNGNIGSMWTTIDEPSTTTASDRWGMLGMAYNYDQLNRLVKAEGYQNFDMEQNQWSLTASDLMYHNSFTYDANGNIEIQRRNPTDQQHLVSLIVNS